MKTGRRGFFGIFAGMAAGAAAIVKADPVSAVASVVPPVSPPAPIPPASLPFRFSAAVCTGTCSIVTSSFVMAPYAFETLDVNDPAAVEAFWFTDKNGKRRKL